MANTATILQQQTVGDSRAGWSETLAFDQFNPAVGTLQSVTNGVTVDTAGSVSVESLDAAPSAVSIVQSGNVDVIGPNSAALVDAASDAFGYTRLAAFDGRTDYTGASGTVVPLAASGTAAATLTSPADILPFIGTGAALVTAVAGTGLDVTGPANMRIESRANVGAAVDRQYDYIPANPVGSGGDSAAGVTVLGYGWWPVGSFATLQLNNQVTTQAQVFTLPASPTSSTMPIEIGQFNPALGTLESIYVNLGGTASTTVGVENESGGPSDVSVTQVATINVGLPGTTVWEAEPISTSATLGGFDGSSDFAGSSGTIIHGAALIQAGTQVVRDATDLAAFTGTGTVAATIGSTGTADLHGPGNLLALLTAQAGGTAEISYAYVPAGISAGAIGWMAAVDGDWSQPDNWGPSILYFGIAPASPPGGPTSTDDVAITTPGSYTVTIDAPQSVHSIVIDSPDATVLLDANLTAADNFVLDAGTVEFNGGTISAGNITLNGGLLTGQTVDLHATGSIAGNVGSGGVSVTTSGVAEFSVGTVVAITDAVTSVGTVVSTGVVLDDQSVPGFVTVAPPDNPAPSGGGSTVMPTSYNPWTLGAALSLECFARGTRISTPNGDTPVEDIAAGDLVRLASGDAAPVVWVGRRRVDCRRHPKPSAVWPVRISKGAFGGSIPHHDLLLSPDHAVFADGVLIPVKYLINGSAVRQVRCDTVDYFHIELPRHAILLAEGLTVESYLDTGNRDSFINGPGPLVLHADFATRVWEAKGVAPLVVTGPAVEAVRQRLAVISAEQGPRHVQASSRSRYSRTLK